MRGAATLSTYFLLTALAAPAAEGETREVAVTITARATSAVKAARHPAGRIPYVLRIRGLRLPGDIASRITVYGESPEAVMADRKAEVRLGFAEGIGWNGGPKLAAPRNLVIPLTQQAARYFEGKSGKIRLWFHLEGVSQLLYTSVEADISASEQPGR